MRGDRGLRQTELGLLAGAQGYSPLVARGDSMPAGRALGRIAACGRRCPATLARCVAPALGSPIRARVDGSAESPQFVWVMAALLFGAGATSARSRCSSRTRSSFDEQGAVDRSRHRVPRARRSRCRRRPALAGLAAVLVGRARRSCSSPAPPTSATTPAASTPSSTSGSALRRCSSSRAAWRCSTCARDRGRLRRPADRRRDARRGAGALGHHGRRRSSWRRS